MKGKVGCSSVSRGGSSGARVNGMDASFPVRDPVKWNLKRKLYKEGFSLLLPFKGGMGKLWIMNEVSMHIQQRQVRRLVCRTNLLPLFRRKSGVVNNLVNF